MKTIFRSLLALFCVVGFSACGGGQCNTVKQSGCDDGLVCEHITGTEKTGCFKPVLLIGSVFDLSDDSAIKNARVVAMDSNGSPASLVGISDADGDFEIAVNWARDEEGVPVNEGVTLRADAGGFQTFPSGVRQAVPIDTTDAAETNTEWIVATSLTNVGLLPQPDGAGTGTISGSVEIGDESPGVLVVAETGSPAVGKTAIADRSGDYKIFNLEEGDYRVQGYTRGYNYDAETTTLSDGEDDEIDLSLSDDGTASLHGKVQIVNAPGDAATSVILVVESTFNENLVRGETPPGLRAPDPGIDPNVKGNFTIEGVPTGNYVILAAFENDILVRDPDQCIAGTDIVHQEFEAGETVTLDESFKVTEALEVLGPGEDGIETVTTTTPTFTWADDSSEDNYHLTVLDQLGNIIWETDVVGSSGDDPEVVYAGSTALESGNFYQFRVVSSKDSCELSQTEDLKGVFFVQ
jgi:hypothetical protein